MREIKGLGMEFEKYKEADEVPECKVCGGTGFLYSVSKVDRIPCKQPGRFLDKPVVVTCYCKLNQRVEDQFYRLRGSEFCDEQQVLKVEGYTGTKNFLLIGNRVKFLRMVKSKFIMLSQIPGYQYHIANGMEIVKEYYVAQEDKSGRTVLDLMRKWQFLAIVFDTNSVNKALSNVISDIISSRAANHVTTWVWTEGNLDSYQEWSPGLNKYFSDPALYTMESLVPGVAEALDLSSLMSRSSIKATAVAESKENG